MPNMPTVCLIGHTEYSLKMRSPDGSLPFGEVNNARKLEKILKKGGIPVTDILDVYELFEVKDSGDERGKLLLDMHAANMMIGCAGIDFITDYNNEASRTFQKNISTVLKKYDNVVLFFLTWAGKSLSMLSTGIQRSHPTIGKEDSYIHASQLSDHFPMKNYAREVNLITSESLLGAENLKFYDVPLDKFVYLPNLAPPEASELLNRSAKEKVHYKIQYLTKLAKENKKTILINEQTLIVGCPSRFVRRKNVDMLLYAFYEIHKKHPQAILVLKGAFDSEFDMSSFYSEKLNQLLLSLEEEPWFLWDKTTTSYPEVLKVYATFDICAHLSGAELGCNTVVEVCTLGIPTLLLDASVNPFLYKGMVEFVKGENLCLSSWPYTQPQMSDLIEKLEGLISDPQKRNEQGLKAKDLAHQRFGAHQQLERIPLMAQAAECFFHKKSDEPYYKDQILEKLQSDKKEYLV